jgi:HAD superfamily hydrolase (TIGR01509 family)
MKPDPEIYSMALEKANTPAGNCVFLDDLSENIEGAERMGMNAILYGPQTDLEYHLKKLRVNV